MRIDIKKLRFPSQIKKNSITTVFICTNRGRAQKENVNEIVSGGQNPIHNSHPGDDRIPYRIKWIPCS